MRRFFGILVLVAGCSGSGDLALKTSSTGPRYFGNVKAPAEDVLTYNNGAEPERIDPGVISGQPDGRVVRTIFEGLTIPNPKTLEPEAGQAYRWEVSPDGRTYTFHLRPGLKWSDGTALTAEDFRWSWVRVLRPETASRYASFLFPVENGEAFNQGEITDERRLGLAAPDESTFVVRLTQPTSHLHHPVLRCFRCAAGDRSMDGGGRIRAPHREQRTAPARRWRQDGSSSSEPALRMPPTCGSRRRAIGRHSTCANLYETGVVDRSQRLRAGAVSLPARVLRFPHGALPASTSRSRDAETLTTWVRRAGYAVDRDAIL
jgi:hypothetical protein